MDSLDIFGDAAPASRPLAQAEQTQPTQASAAGGDGGGGGGGAGEVLWELKWSSPPPGEAALSGPHRNSLMLQWAAEGHFAKRGGAFARRIRDGKPQGDFYNVERLDFEIYE